MVVMKTCICMPGFASTLSPAQPTDPTWHQMSCKEALKCGEQAALKSTEVLLITQPENTVHAHRCCDCCWQTARWRRSAGMWWRSAWATWRCCSQPRCCRRCCSGTPTHPPQPAPPQSPLSRPPWSRNPTPSTTSSRTPSNLSSSSSQTPTGTLAAPYIVALFKFWQICHTLCHGGALCNAQTGQWNGAGRVA